jgi:transcriptional regulator with XRE-family HTH domain
MRTRGMVTQPALKDLVALTGISKGYASDILTGSRKPSRRVAIHIYRRTGWRHELIAGLTPEQIDALEAVDPFQVAA